MTFRRCNSALTLAVDRSDNEEIDEFSEGIDVAEEPMGVLTIDSSIDGGSDAASEKQSDRIEIVLLYSSGLYFLCSLQNLDMSGKYSGSRMRSAAGCLAGS